MDPESQENLIAVLKEDKEAPMSKRTGYVSASIISATMGDVSLAWSSSWWM